MTDAHPSEAWFQLVVESAPNAMLMVDDAGQIRLVNRGAEALFGYDRSELIGRAVEVLLPARFARGHAAHALEFLRSPSARVMGTGRDLYGLRKDGTEVPIEIGLSPAETPAGRFTVASIVDITERTALQERFRDLAESLPQMVWTCTGDGLCDYLSPQWATYTGVPEAEQLGDRWLERLHPDDVATSRARWARAAASGDTFDTELRLRRHDGVYRWFKARAVPVRAAAGRIRRWFGSNTDIQDLRDAQDATARLNRELEARVAARTDELRRSEALQRAIVTYAGSAIIAADPHGTITLFNRAAEELLGYAAEELIGVATPALIHDPAEVEARRADLEGELGVTIASPFEVFVIKSRAGGTDAYEWTYVRKDGSRVPVLLTISSIRGDGGEVVGYLGVAVDLTRRKEQERELLELNRLLGERSAQREVLLQEVHHRVKNNLQVIASLVSMQIRHVTDASARAALAECRARVESIALIHETLYQSKDYARIPFSDYARTLASSILRAAGPSGVALALDIEALTLPVDAAIPCGLILNELVTNALKHAFPGGRRGTVRVSLRRSSAGEAALTVADDGVGLADDFSERPTRSLGLQLVAALVAQIDGRLEVSRVGGARFCVSFPLPEPP